MVLNQPGPLRGRVVVDGRVDQVVGEFEAGCGVGIHCCRGAIEKG